MNLILGIIAIIGVGFFAALIVAIILKRNDTDDDKDKNYIARIESLSADAIIQIINEDGHEVEFTVDEFLKARPILPVDHRTIQLSRTTEIEIAPTVKD